MDPSSPSPRANQPQFPAPRGMPDDEYARRWVDYAMSRDPVQAIQLDVLFGIRRWMEYLWVTIVIGIVLIVLLGRGIV